MKKLIFAVCTFTLLAGGFSAAGTTTSNNRGSYGSSPVEILDNVAGEANVEYKIQETQLDNVNDDQGAFASKFKIANTLDSIRIQIAPYLQWMFYIGLSIATILIIYNGILLVTGAVSGEEIKKVQGRIKNIAIGIAVLTGFAIIVRIFIALMSSVLT